MRVVPGTAAEHYAKIHRLAVEAFARHEIRHIGDAGDTRVFAFARPGIGAFAVRIVFWPYWIAVAGDVGDTLFMCSHPDSFAWALGSARSTDYALSKVQQPHRVFCAGDAIAYVHEREISDYLADWLDGAEDREPSEFYEACRADGIDEPPGCTAYTQSHVWAVEALAAFGAKYERTQAP